MRRAARIDPNQREIVEALRRLGCSVQPLHTVGGGVPDLLVGWRGRNFLLEVKRPFGPRGGASAVSLNDEQRLWHEVWRGHAAVVRTVDDALEAVGAEHA
jgi:hypothetical protein